MDRKNVSRFAATTKIFPQAISSPFIWCYFSSDCLIISMVWIGFGLWQCVKVALHGLLQHCSFAFNLICNAWLRNLVRRSFWKFPRHFYFWKLAYLWGQNSIQVPSPSTEVDGQYQIGRGGGGGWTNWITLYSQTVCIIQVSVLSGPSKKVVSSRLEQTFLRQQNV